MLPQRGTVVSIVSFVRGIFKTWEGRLRGKERGKWEYFRECLEEWYRVLATLIRDTWIG